MATLRSKTIPPELIATLTKLPRLQTQLREMSQDVAVGIPDAVNEALDKANDALELSEQTKVQPFLLVGPSPSLPNGRTLVVGTGLSASDVGPGENYQLSVQAFLAALSLLVGNGLVAKTASGAELRTIEAGSTRIEILNGDGSTGNPAIDIDEPSLDLANMGGTLGVDHGGTGVTVYSAFSAHNNGTAQTIPNGAWTQLAMSTEAFDLNGNFASGAWTPPAGRPVTLTASAFLVMGASGEVNIAIFKNGVQYRRGSNQTGAGNVLVHLTCIDVPNGTDVYTARIFQNSGASQDTNGNDPVTYFQGAML